MLNGCLKVLNDLLTAPAFSVIDPEVNQSRVEEVRLAAEKDGRRREEELELRRRKALQDIKEVGRMMEAKGEMGEDRRRLAEQLEKADLSIEPSSRSLAWWRRLSPELQTQRRRFRQ